MWEQIMGRVLRVLAVLLSVAVLLATALLQPGLFGTLGLFLMGMLIFLLGAGLSFAKSLQNAHHDAF
jgi:hypothetical protein